MSSKPDRMITVKKSNTSDNTWDVWDHDGISVGWIFSFLGLKNEPEVDFTPLADNASITLSDMKRIVRAMTKIAHNLQDGEEWEEK